MTYCVLWAPSWCWEYNEPDGQLGRSRAFGSLERACVHAIAWRRWLEGHGEGGVLAVMDAEGGRHSAVLHVIPVTVPVAAAG